MGSGQSPVNNDQLELTPSARMVLERRYLIRDDQGKPVEGAADLFHRVAQNIASAERNYGASDEEVAQWEQRFYEVMARLEFLPNSPTLMNAGRRFQQLSACFVLPIEDTMESIFETVKNTALIHKSGGGTGFSFSRLRPKEDIVSSTRGVSSGPVSFMRVFDAATDAIKQGGTRRGANMAVLRVDHPDIMEFIRIKTDQSLLTNFNISVTATDEFMQALADDDSYDLINPRTGEAVETVQAREVFDEIVNSAWQCGDPGVVFIDRINESNPTPELGEIESTNPCGEQPLLPYESCNLGSINLARMVTGEIGAGQIDWEKLADIVQVAVRFLDNVIDMNKFPLEEIAENTRANRKVGLGIMGFADTLIRLGIRYDSEAAVDIAEQLMKFILEQAQRASTQLAEQRGTFPNWDRSIYSANGNGLVLRNATLTTIAPTGSISIIAGASSGIEPLFAVAFTRHVLDGEELLEVNALFEQVAHERGFHSPELMKQIAARGSLDDIEEIPTDVRELFCTAHDITPEWHIQIQAAFQKYTDNAVSKTINLGNEASVGDVRAAYMLAYELGCKGVTIYRDGCRETQVLSTGKTEQARGLSVEPRPRPEAVTGVTRTMMTGCGKLYVTINSDDRGPFEVFGNMGKAGGCVASQTEGLARLISLALRSGIGAEHIVKQLKGISCHMPAWEAGGGKVFSCADAFAQALERTALSEAAQLRIDFNPERNGHAGACPECGGVLYHEEGCRKCYNCGFSQCD